MQMVRKLELLNKKILLFEPGLVSWVLSFLKKTSRF